MGSCVSKTTPDNCIVKVNPTQSAKDQEEDSKFKSSTSLRKNMKQKKALIDSRIQDSNNTDNINGREVQKKKTSADIKLIKTSLSKHFIFSSLLDTQRDLVIESMKLFAVNTNELIFEQDSKGNAFYVVASGRLEVIVNEKRVNVIKEGESFGELALLHDTPRSATIKTVMNTTLWVLDRRTFRSCLQEMNMQNYKENSKFIDSVPMFQVLSPGQRELLVSCLTILNYSSGSKIVNEGDPGDLFYVIKEGTVICTQGGREIRKMGKGEFFGELALLYGSQRTATVIAVDQVVCAALSRDGLTSSLGASLEQIIYKNSMRIAIEKSSYLKKLNKTQVDNLVSGMQTCTYPENTIVIERGKAKKDDIFVIVKGEIRGSKTNTTQKVFDVLGEAEVIKESQDLYEEDWLSVGEVSLAYITASGFANSIGGEYSKVTSNNEAIQLLKRIQLFKGLDARQLEDLTSVLKIREYQDGELIVEQNNPGDSFFIIKNGKVEIIKDNQVIRSVTKHDYFGERSLMFDNFRSASVFARKKVICWVLYKSDFLQILNDNIKKQLLERIELQDDSILLNELAIVKTLGAGMFGNVFLTVHKQKRKLYALKTVDRRKISAYEIEENIVLERKILLQLDHVLIMKLVKTFKDSKRLYFLLEYIEGMDLFDVLRKLGLLKECDARFYTACIFVILEHLHERGIIYRDLKPENMVVDLDGYPKLIDFGTAKFVSGRTYTIVGTPHYMAPEVITSHGYGLSADYWTVGIMLYEFVVGYMPFGEEESDPYAIYEEVQIGKLVFPNWLDNKNKIREFVQQLLSKNPANRLGGSFENLKGNFWFSGFNWDKITSKELKAPYVPIGSSQQSNIETALSGRKGLEEFILKVEMKEEVPQSKRRSRAPPDWDCEF